VTISTESKDDDYDKFGGGSDTIILQVENKDAPSINWVLPVADEQIFTIADLSPILLRAATAGAEPISKMRFQYWDPEGGIYITIGEDLSAPYEATLANVIDLKENDYTQVFAYAFGPDPDGGGPELPTASIHKRILIFRGDVLYRIYMPFVE
jgi:hypothetical protein